MSRAPATSEREQEAEWGRGVTARTGSLEGSRQAVSEPGPLPGATSPAGRPRKSSGEARIQPAERISRNRLEGLVPPMWKGCDACIQAGPLGELQSRETGRLSQARPQARVKNGTLGVGWQRPHCKGQRHTGLSTHL